MGKTKKQPKFDIIIQSVINFVMSVLFFACKAALLS